MPTIESRKAPARIETGQKSEVFSLTAPSVPNYPAQYSNLVAISRGFGPEQFGYDGDLQKKIPQSPTRKFGFNFVNSLYSNLSLMLHTSGQTSLS